MKKKVQFLSSVCVIDINSISTITVALVCGLINDMIKQNRKIKRTILSVLKGISEKNRTTILMGTPEIINTTQKIVVTVPYFLNVNDNSILACRGERLSKINGVELR